MRPRVPGVWIGRATVAAAAALLVNFALGAVGYEHDASLLSLLIMTSVAAGVLALEALEAHTRISWTTHNPTTRPDPGEDIGTTSFRHVIEVHETARDADDAVLWQIADLAQRRLRQVHGLHYGDDPARVTELLGPQLADLVSRDRRHRYQPDRRRPRYTVAQLGELVDRIEAL
jgi:hypothetical protein